MSSQRQEYISPFFLSFQVWEVGKDTIFKGSAMWTSVLLNGKLLKPRIIQFDKVCKLEDWSYVFIHPKFINVC